jgi:hypothetical protein
MGAPTNPLRLQVIDRVVAVLAAIVAGSNYFFTPFEVVKRFKHWNECHGFPTYMVFTDSGGAVELSGVPDLYTENFYVNVKGYVQDNSDTVTKLEQAIRDIRKAIDVDSKSAAAGSLGALADEVRIEKSPDTDNGYLSLEGFGFFDQQIRVMIEGTYGEL